MASPREPDPPSESPAAPSTSALSARRSSTAAAYWRANKRLIAVLLLVWATVSYGCGILFVDWLNRFSIGQLPLGFWFAQQGSIYVFVVLIFVYAVAMDRLDRRYAVGE